MLYFEQLFLLLINWELLGSSLLYQKEPQSACRGFRVLLLVKIKIHIIPFFFRHIFTRKVQQQVTSSKQEAKHIDN